LKLNKRVLSSPSKSAIVELFAYFDRFRSDGPCHLQLLLQSQNRFCALLRCVVDCIALIKRRVCKLLSRFIEFVIVFIVGGICLSRGAPPRIPHCGGVFTCFPMPADDCTSALTIGDVLVKAIAYRSQNPQ